MTTARQQLARLVRQAMLDSTDWYLISQTAPEGHVALVTDGPRNAVAVFKAGEWVRPSGKPLTFAPTMWLGPKQ